MFEKKALAKIYTMHSFAPFSKLNLLFKNTPTLCARGLHIVEKSLGSLSKLFLDACGIFLNLTKVR